MKPMTAFRQDRMGSTSLTPPKILREIDFFYLSFILPIDKTKNCDILIFIRKRDRGEDNAMKNILIYYTLFLIFLVPLYMIFNFKITDKRIVATITIVLTIFSFTIPVFTFVAFFIYGYFYFNSKI